MKEDNASKEATELWYELYLTLFARKNNETLHAAMASLPTQTKYAIDVQAHAIIDRYLHAQRKASDPRLRGGRLTSEPVDK